MTEEKQDERQDDQINIILRNLAEILTHLGGLKSQLAGSNEPVTGAYLAGNLIDPLAEMLSELARAMVINSSSQNLQNLRLDQCEFFLLPMTSLMPPRIHLAHVEVSARTLLNSVLDLGKYRSELEAHDGLAVAVAECQTGALALARLLGKAPLVAQGGDELGEEQLEAQGGDELGEEQLEAQGDEIGEEQLEAQGDEQ